MGIAPVGIEWPEPRHDHLLVYHSLSRRVGANGRDAKTSIRRRADGDLCLTRAKTGYSYNEPAAAHSELNPRGSSGGRDGAGSAGCGQVARGPIRQPQRPWLNEFGNSRKTNERTILAMTRSSRAAVVEK